MKIIMSLDQNPKDLVEKKPGKLNLNEFKLLKPLGEGAFGKVFLTKNTKDGSYWAFKQLKKSEIIKAK